MKFNSSILLFGVLSLSIQFSWGQIPPGYYDNAEGLTGEALRQALKEIIDDHEVADNSDLWNHFEVIDQKQNGKVWDIYSDVPGGSPAYEFTFGIDQCGNYDSEGDCFNREHSFPQSWYDDAPPMSTDLFHIYPTDGYVNSKRSNNAYGKVGSATWTSSNGCKLGNCVYPGYSGVVFEPIDEYKGDVARSYFYMLTRYADLVNAWQSPMLDADNFSGWTRNLLLEWAASDPVSQKEIDRNEGIYDIQGNRNPYIDHPEYAVYVWDELSVGQQENFTRPIKAWISNNTLYAEQVNEAVLSISVMTGTGQILYSTESTGTVNQLPTSLQHGLYFVRLETRDQVKVLRYFPGQ